MIRLAAVCCSVVFSFFLMPHPAMAVEAPAPEVLQELELQLTALKELTSKCQERAFSNTTPGSNPEQLLADVKVCEKAVEWILRHQEFYKPDYLKQTQNVLDLGKRRAEAFLNGNPNWMTFPGSTVLGYFSQVDGSVQPYVVTVPADFDQERLEPWSLHINLHGRAGEMNEVNFIDRWNHKSAPKEQTWIQLDVFGRTNNAYRWSGETDVFEALADLQQRYRIDRNRIVLRGFSMGGAGAWHLGLHHPSRWCSVGPGAGFVETYKYLGIKEPLPPWQDKTLSIYDAIDYVLNASAVPVCTYGGELDKQLVASTSMVDQAKKLNVKIELIVGPGVEHKFHPDSWVEFLEFHTHKAEQGRVPYPGSKSFRFMTYTLKYNQCEGVKIAEMLRHYEPAVIECSENRDGDLVVNTKNVAVLELTRDLGDFIVIDGDFLPLSNAADGLLPEVYYELGRDGWSVMSYDDSKEFPSNPQLRKRHNLQGPIDDAFMESFVCVRGTGEPWSQQQHDWAMWTLERFEKEFDKWLRGNVQVIDDQNLTETDIQHSNLILFGDPGSNAVLSKVLEKLPVKWTKDGIEIEGQKYDPNKHGLSLIYPNPLNPRRYVVINSGHTFHEKDFQASNAMLYPRLGDIAIQQFEKTNTGDYRETILWADIFNDGWRFYPAKSEPSPE